MLQAGVAAVEEACSGPGFVEALARQGLELAELQPGSPLSQDRRAAMLAAVLEEKELLRQSGHSSRSHAAVYRRQLERQLAEAVRLARDRWEQRHQVVQSQQELEAQRREADSQRAAEEEMRLERVRARDEAAEEERRERAQSRDEAWRAALVRAEEVVDARTSECQAALEAKDGRSERCIERRQEERAFQKEQLQKRFELVVESVQRAHEDEETMMREKDERLQEVFNRSESHMQACRLSSELKQQHVREKSRDRQHQVVRVARMKDHQRFIKVTELEEDQAVFKKCSQFKEVMQHELHYLAVLQGMSLPDGPPPIESRAGFTPKGA